MHLHQSKVAFITVQLQRLHRGSPSSSYFSFSTSSSSSIYTLPLPQRQILIIFQINRKLIFFYDDDDEDDDHHSDVVSSCRGQRQQRRFSSRDSGALATASLMLHHFYKTKSSNSLVVFMILLCLTSKVTCLREVRSKDAVTFSDQENGAPVIDEPSRAQDISFCFDGDGERHGLFSSWRDSSTGCQCSCQSVGSVLISLCDDNCAKKLAGDLEDDPSFLSQNDEAFVSLVSSGTSDRNTNFAPKAKKLRDTSCQDKNSGSRYLDGQSWMSNSRACAKCYCTNGTADCEGSVLHCQFSCLPGQKAVTTAHCCQHRCIGEPSVSAAAAAAMASCTAPAGQHGEVSVRHQQCVDQWCQCINGNWFCIDTCTPLEELQCPPEERIFWDPFCCPRCRGTKRCTVTVATINWLEEVPMRKGLPRFVSVFTPEGEKEVLNGAPRLAASMSGTPAEGEEEGAEKTSVITVEPAQHLVTHAGRCVCTDGELRCSRPGAGIWHDTDCYYSHGRQGRYYARGEHWKAHNDECSDCQCLEGRQYTCARTPCSALFLCPSGKVPVAAPGDCCPSTCEDATQNSGEEDFYHSPREIEQVPAEKALEMREPVPEWTPTLTNGGKCKPLGDLTATTEVTSNIFLPSESLVIIRRACVSLKCVCSSEGNWVCADYCIPCQGVSTQGTDATPRILHPVHLRTSDGCCPKCSAAGDKEESAHFGERYSLVITCFLALLALTPLFVVIVCCICLRYRQKLKKLRSNEHNQSKFHLEDEPPTHSAQSSLGVPLTISTNAGGVSPPICLDKAPPVFGGRDSIHQSLLFGAKVDETPLTSVKSWRLSASYSCIPDIKHTQIRPTNCNSGDSTPKNSLLMATPTSNSGNASFKDLQKVVLTHTLITDTPCSSSPMSSSSPQLAKAEYTATESRSDWRRRLRRSYTQPRTHFFPHAWKAMLSKSAVAAVASPSLSKDYEVMPFFSALHTHLSKTGSAVVEAPNQIINARNSASIDLAIISEVV